MPISKINIKIQLLFFGATADVIGSRELEVDLIEGESVSSLLERLQKQNPRIASEKLLVAINEEYAKPDVALKAGDEVAIFTAVSGG